MNQSEAIEKIKKLLKTKGRTEAEADTAQILAAAMAAKHGIDIAALDAPEEMKRNEIRHKVVGQWAVTPPEAQYASLICTNFFEVSAITGAEFIKHRWMVVETEIMVGTEWHLQVAEYVFNFLIKEFRWQWNKRRGRCKNRKQFMWGIYLGLRRKLRERFASERVTTELEISFSAKRDAYMKEQWPKQTTHSITPQKNKGAAVERGRHAGMDIEIRPGVQAGEQSSQEALPGFSTRLLGNGS